MQPLLTFVPSVATVVETYGRMKIIRGKRCLSTWQSRLFVPTHLPLSVSDARLNVNHGPSQNWLPNGERICRLYQVRGQVTEPNLTTVLKKFLFF